MKNFKKFSEKLLELKLRIEQKTVNYEYFISFLMNVSIYFLRSKVEYSFILEHQNVECQFKCNPFVLFVLIEKKSPEQKEQKIHRECIYMMLLLKY